MAELDPKPYEEWRRTPAERAEDAAYVFGHDLIRRCRDEALGAAFARLPPESDARAVVEEAVDKALHNVLDLIEGLWPMQAGEHHPVRYRLEVVVHDVDDSVVEAVEISGTDLPIGFWKWRDGEFR